MIFSLFARRSGQCACLVEAQALSKLLKEFPEITAWFSFSCQDGEHISEGQRFADVIKEIESNPQIVAVGINCTSPRFVPSLIREAKKVTNKPVLAYPNSGESYSADKKVWNKDPVSDSFGNHAREWYDAGARMIGGCCRSTVEDIEAIAGWARNIT